ncbi:MAG: DUF3127 domain-containing protein [Flavobacteriales bacterium]|nr:DUF3127 domain-containing protein [Flavobacteriales bacterium]
MDITGTLKQIKDEQAFASGFTKREFVITTEDQFPQEIVFELIKEKGSIIDNFKVGEKLKVTFDIKGREWQGKHFVNLNAWKVESLGAGATVASAPSLNEPPPAAPMPETFNAPVDDDLPF